MGCLPNIPRVYSLISRASTAAAPKSPCFSRVYDLLSPRRNRKLEDGRVVEGSDVVVRAGGNKGQRSGFPFDTKAENRRGSSLEESAELVKGSRSSDSCAE